MKLLTAICVIGLLAAGLAACGNPAPSSAYDRWHGDIYRGGGSDGGGGGGGGM